MPPRRRRWLGSGVALLVVCAVGVLAWYLTHRDAPAPSGPQAKASAAAASRGGSGGGASPRGPPPSTVGVATATKQDLPVYLDALGTVTPVVTATVRAQVSGTLVQLLYDEGQMVKKGQLLAVVDPRPFDIALQQASAARQRDQAQFENARLTLERYRTLLQQDSIARQDVDTQAALVKQLEGTLALDRAAENAARLNLAYSRIVAPVAGRIGLRTVDLGNVVGPGDANGVAVITQLAPIDVAFAVPQDRLPEVQARLRSGARLSVTAFDRTRTKQLGEGVFATLDNQIDTQTGTVKAKARFGNAEGSLFPNQFVNVQVLLRTIEGAVVVPVTALRHGSGGDFVYVLKEDRSVGARRAGAMPRRPVVRRMSGISPVVADGFGGGVIRISSDRRASTATSCARSATLVGSIPPDRRSPRFRRVHLDQRKRCCVAAVEIRPHRATIAADLERLPSSAA